MKHTNPRRVLSFLTVLALMVSLLSGLSLTVFADTLTGTATGYTKASDVVYDNSGTYLKNWGARGELACFLTSYAQEYYTGSYSYASLSANSGSSNSNSYTSSALYTALRSMVSAKQTYVTDYQETRSMYCYTDCVNSNNSYISSFYSATKLTGSWDGSWNREHTWPQSKSSGSQLEDIMMLRPTSSTENSSRGNKAYGESSGYYNPNNEAGSLGIDLRGDCARIVLYCYVRWDNQDYMWGSGGVIESVDVLLNWMEADPVDTWEMGRNDVVQSITGVRNCFVDYPELAFLLFGQEVPANYPSPSAGTSEAYTVTALSNNNSYGTVSVNGYTVTASPKSGYYTAGYTLVSGTASVTQNGNVFTVVPSSDCTLRIDFAAKQPVTLSFMANGSLYSTVSAYAGDSVTLPASASDVADWTVVGWSTAPVADSTEKPSYYSLGASFMPTASTTLYAVYLKTEGGTGSGEWTLLTDAADLTPGMRLILANNEDNVTAGDISSSVMESLSSGFSADKSTITSLDAGTVELTLGGSAGAWTLSNDNGQLLGSTAVKKLAWDSGTTTWSIGISNSNATIQNATSSYGRFLYNHSSPRFTTYTSSVSNTMLLPQLYYLDGSQGVTTYSTNPSGQAHTHSLSYVSAVSPSCAQPGHIAYWYCAGCGKYFSDANAQTEISLDSTLIPATGVHSYGSWSSNGDGTHSRICAVCQSEDSASCSYNAVVTAPTASEQGYTTYTCTLCGYSYVDDYTAPLGQDYTVSFTTPTGVEAPAPMVSNTNTGITLPTAEAPEGYSFLGWVTEDYDNVQTRPAEILTGAYTAPSDITLKALYTYNQGGGDSAPALVVMGLEDTLAEGDKIVITAKDLNSGEAYALYQQTVSNSYVNKYAFTNDVESVLADEKNYLTVSAASQGWYLGDEENGWLYNSGSNNLSVSTADKSVWTLTTLDGSLALTANNRHLSYRYDLTNNYWRMGGTNLGTNGNCQLTIYKLTEGEGGTAYYTTIINAPHVHTPAEPVIENEAAATCTAAGSYDSVIYCAECGEEISRETITVPALGHDPKAAVQENNVEPGCTAEGSYDNVVYCDRCGQELSRETVTVPALGHNPGEPVQENYVEPTATTEGGYDTVVYCQRCNQELSREHTVLEPTGPAEPIETTDLKLFESVTVGTNMKVAFTIRTDKLSAYENYYIEVVKQDPVEGDLVTRFGPGQEQELEISGTAYKATYMDIVARQMGVYYSARVHAFDANGQEFIGPELSNCIRDFLAAQLLKTNLSKAQLTLAADMLNYGAAAQIFRNYETDHLVNEELSEAALEMLDTYETKELPEVNKTNNNTIPDGQSNILFSSISMQNSVQLQLNIRLDASTENVQVKVTKHETGEQVALLDAAYGTGAFAASFDQVGAKDMRTEYDFVTLVNGVETGNVRTISIEGCVAEIRKGTNAKQINLANALLTYGDSAAAAVN